jgi:hypothetical protein
VSDADLRRLLDLEALKRLKAAYCRFVDTKRWDDLRGLFTPDARFEGFAAALSGGGVDRFIAGISARFATATSAHHCHMPEIAFTGPDAARGVWAMMDHVDLGAGEALAEAPESRGFVGMGHYEDEYRRVDGNWKIAFSRLTRLRVDFLPRDHPLVRPGLLPLSRDWLG